MTKKKAKSTVQAVKPQGPEIQRRQQWTCSVKDCDYHSVVERACPRHPQAKLVKVSM